MPSPGWYPDPQDAQSYRWFDGDAWTEYRQSDAVASDPGNPAGDPANAGGPSYDPYATYAEPAYGGGGIATAPATSTETEAFAPVAAEPVDPNGRVVGPSHLAHGRRSGFDRKILLIVAIVVVVVAGLIFGGIALFSGGSTQFTYQGKSISGAAKTLTSAEGNLATLVSQRHGVKSSSTTRCYFAVPSNPLTGKKTDIDSQLRCGPVLFVDGDATKAYLSFGFTAAASGSSVTLTPQTAPQSNTPDALPAGFSFKRPDGKTPAASTGLEVPNPPAADANVLTAAAVAEPSGSKPVTAIIGSLVGGITITDYGKVTRYGTGDGARSAPPGQLLYAFKTVGAAGNSGDIKDLSSNAVLSVDGGPNKAMPTEATGQSVVIAVPDTTKSISLVLVDSGITQTFSVIDDKLGAGNVAVLARTHRDATVNQTASATYNYSTKVVFTDKSTGTTQTASITLATVTLAYHDDLNNVSASAPDKAFLIPDIVYTGSHDGGPFGIDTALLTFTPAGGAAIPAKNISTDGSKIRNVFEVPANVTAGTVTVGGTATETFSGGTGTYTVSVATPVGIPVTIPAG